MGVVQLEVSTDSDEAVDSSLEESGTRRRLFRRKTRGTETEGRKGQSRSVSVELSIAPNDPVIAYLQEAGGPVEIASLSLESPALESMRAAGVVLVVPLIASGELIGIVALGPRLSERGYSSDDLRLLDSLASHAAPAMRVGQLVEEQQAEARRRERIEQELVVAQLIQQQFLPKSLPELSGWSVNAFYRPARTVGGDFYDFVELPNGRVMIVVGDVTDKGVPAALVMASTHSLLRSTAPRLLSPGATLAQVNNLLCGDIPAQMFVTCIAIVLDPVTGRIEYANAGHDVPYLRTDDGVVELRARGMPLGLMPDMTYEEKEMRLAAGNHLLLHSDGLAEAHNEKREMFGFPRVLELAGRPLSGQALIDDCLAELDRFSGAGHEQEDDITLVTLECRQILADEASSGGRDAGAELVSHFSIPSKPGNERLALARVAEAAEGAELPKEKIDRLKTAVAEATMNAIEHGNENREELSVEVTVTLTDASLIVLITDHGGRKAQAAETELPDLDLKLAGMQSARGWGLFLIENMVDEMTTLEDDEHHTVRLVVHRGGGDTRGGSDG